MGTAAHASAVTLLTAHAPTLLASFTCTTFWPEYLVAGTAQECGPQYNASVGLCLDGLNAGGLAVAALGVFQPVDASYSECRGAVGEW